MSTFERDYITLHPKHGLNPTVCVCPYCGKEKNEIALLGAEYKGRAPSKSIINLIPCELCEKKMALGITFIEVDDPEKPIPKRWVVIKREAVEKLPIDDELKERILEVGKTYIDSKAMDMMFFAKDILNEEDSLDVQNN